MKICNKLGQLVLVVRNDETPVEIPGRTNTYGEWEEGCIEIDETSDGLILYMTESGYLKMEVWPSAVGEVDIGDGGGQLIEEPGGSGSDGDPDRDPES